MSVSIVGEVIQPHWLTGCTEEEEGLCYSKMMSGREWAIQIGKTHG